MKIAVLSDSHDNLWKLDAAAEAIRSADAVIHCGDLCSPFMVRRLGEIAGERPVHIVWGNNDGDTFLIGQVAAAFPSIQLHGALAEIELGGLRIAVNHYPHIATGLARSGMYDVVCYGHDHTRHESRENGCLVLNPGELMGMKGSSSLAVLDTEGRQVAWIEVP
jgi:putative phosphoesterase